MIDTTAATLTLERFAALESCWPEYLGDGVLLARIHPRNNRPVGDEEVLARALVFIPPRTYGGLLGAPVERAEGHLARLTIRTTNLTGDEYGRLYAQTLLTVLTLPVIELS